MKKVLLIISLFFMPLIVCANTIENYYINATIENNGDLLVEEYFYIDGTFNGMERIIDYANLSAANFIPSASYYGGSKLHNGSGIEILEVRALEKDENFDFTNIDGELFSKTSSASKGDYGVYTENNNINGTTIRMFLPSYKDEAFYVKYIIKDIAILHNDVGELGWNVVGKSLANYIDNLVVTVNVPNNKNVPKVWGHGPLNGYTKIIDNNTVTARIINLSSYTAVDIRLTFDKDVISNSNKKSNVDALDKIIKYETMEAEKANKIREQNKLNALHRIEYAFEDIEKTPSRANYDEAEYWIRDLTYIIEDNEELEAKQKEYYEKLYTYQGSVDKYEYKNFESYFEGEERYDRLEKANDVIDKVFDYELKNKMRLELEDYKNRLVKIEMMNELKLSLLSLLTLGISYLVYYVYKKNVKKKKANVEPLYVREIPSELSPECVGLLTDSILNGNEVSAALLDMIRRKVVTYEKKDNGSFDFSYDLTNKNLDEDDKQVAKLIFKRKLTINSKKIGKIDYDDFVKWKKQILKRLHSKFLIEKYDDSKEEVDGNLLVTGLIFSFTPLFIIGFILLTIYAIKRYRLKIFMWLLIPINILLLIMSIATNHYIHITYIFVIISIIAIKMILRRFPVKLKIKKTEHGIKEANKWNGLRNFLIDFSTINEREIPEVELWEKYLVYATAFGIGEEVLKSMKLKIDSAHIDTEVFDNYVLFNSINDISSIIRETSTVAAKTSVAASSRMNFPSGGSSGGSYGGGYSSGGGGGGGFSGGSSGGGSFGGGGGGGTF